MSETPEELGFSTLNEAFQDFFDGVLQGVPGPYRKLFIGVEERRLRNCFFAGAISMTTLVQRRGTQEEMMARSAALSAEIIAYGEECKADAEENAEAPVGMSAPLHTLEDLLGGDDEPAAEPSQRPRSHSSKRKRNT